MNQVPFSLSCVLKLFDCILSLREMGMIFQRNRISSYIISATYYRLFIICLTFV
jgi:hypothetical protein